MVKNLPYSAGDAASIPGRSVLKDISPGISLEGMMLKLKLQYVGHLMLKS